MKKFILFLLLPFTMVSQTYSHATVLGDWGGYRYFISKEKFSFWDAHNHIKSVDSTLDLLSIHSIGESMFVYNKVGEKVGMSPTPPYYWLGGHDENEEGVWEWTDGSDWDYQQWTTDTTEAQYGPEPNNLGGDEHYLMVYYYSNGGWNDATNYSGDIPFYYVFKSAITTSQDTTNNPDIQIPTLENKVYPTFLQSDYAKFTFESGWDGPTKIIISDGSGKIVSVTYFEDPEIEEVKLPLLSAGVYHGIAVSGKDRFRFKLLLTK